MSLGPIGGSVATPRPALPDEVDDLGADADVGASTETAATTAPQAEWSGGEDVMEPAPAGTGAAGAAAPTGATNQAAADAAKLTATKDIMKQSPTGAAALKYLEDNNLPVKFANGGGSYWDGTNIVIDRSQNSQAAALTLVHEINHAKASKTGTSGNITSQSRNDYVSTMLNEEVRGTVDSIKAKNEMVASGKSITATFPLEDKYNAAYKAATDALKAKNPKATAAELKAAGEQAGYDRVMKGFKDGEVVTSVNGQKYSDYYGGAWDRNHPTPPAAH